MTSARLTVGPTTHNVSMYSTEVFEERGKFKLKGVLMPPIIGFKTTASSPSADPGVIHREREYPFNNQ